MLGTVQSNLYYFVRIHRKIITPYSLSMVHTALPHWTYTELPDNACHRQTRVLVSSKTLKLYSFELPLSEQTSFTVRGIRQSCTLNNLRSNI